ncbi:MAG: glycosyltransferase [Paludibacteraceae bacterium]|nr:glycosyltransferase [Paludibacteraceae bacterium]
MNILFVTDHKVTLRSGGIERVVRALGEAFESRLGWSVCYACIEPSEEGVSCFDFLSANLEERLEDFLRERNIHCVMDELMVRENTFGFIPSIHRACRNASVRHVYSYHMMPKYEITDTGDLDFVCYALLHGHNIRHNLQRLLMLSWLRFFGESFFMAKMRRKYSVAYEHSDLVVLETERYVDDYLRMCGGTDRNRIAAVPNPLPYGEQDMLIIPNDEKKKRVMMVARMEEDHKRVWLALKIWERVVRQDDLQEWTLTLIGEGSDWELFKRKAHAMQLPRIEFPGNQDLSSYYASTPILMMTSAYEGLPMVLLEAQQNRVVPIAFDSFASVHDVIERGENGLLVRNNDVKAFAAALEELMRNPGKRKRFSERGFETSRNFSMDKIVRKWQDILS